MAVARDVLTQNVGGATSFTHTPVGTPRGVTVLIASTSATDTVTGVTYGGVAMDEATGSPVVSTSGEGGVCYAYTLGASVPTGAQTVEITGTGTLRVIVQSATAGGDCEFVVGTLEALGVSGDQTVTLSTGGRESAVTIAAWSEAGTVGGVDPLTGWTAAAGGEADEGSESTYRYSFDTVGTADVTAGVNVPSSAGLAFIAVAIVEAAGAGAYTLDADSASYAYTATAAGVEHNRLLDADAASYTYTANDATLTRDIPLSADSAAYAWTAQDADLEYVPIGSTYTLDADAAAYLWSATDADLVYVQLTHYLLDADGAAYTWSANDAALSWSGAPVDQPSAYGGGDHDYEMRVRHYWDEIDRLRRENTEREAATRERVRKAEELEQDRKRVESRKLKTRKAKEARAVELARIEEDIARAETEAAQMRDLIAATVAEIERIEAERAAFELSLQLRRRNAALALLMMAAI